MKIQNIWGVGRNYGDHAKELNNPIPEKPLIFLKAGSCLHTSQKISLPTWTSNIHYECELAIQLDNNLQPHRLALALDLTARDQQAESKKKGEPWTLAKSFTGSCPIGEFIAFPHNFSTLSFTLEINGQLKQKGHVKDMIFPLETLVHYLRQHFPVQAGDLILTGTPAGVGPLQSGDELEAKIDHHLQTSWSVK